jgi:tryptophan synthase alpha subunit
MTERSSAIREAIETANRQGRTALITFLTAGFPTLAESPSLLKTLCESSDVFELGMPFSDPVGEGPVIQESSFIALSNGITPAMCFDLVAGLRAQGVTTPIVLMGYYNPIMSMGEDEYCRRTADCGADGLIVVDLPAEEADSLIDACERHGLDHIPLVAPTSDDARLALSVARASGFIYCVSVAGVTGARGTLPDYLPEFLARVRRHTDLPIAVGFGISKREHVEAVGKLAEGAAIGSALVSTVRNAPPGESDTYVRKYIEDVTGRSGATA